VLQEEIINHQGIDLLSKLRLLYQKNLHVKRLQDKQK